MKFLSVHEEQVSGIVKTLPIVGMWENQDGRLLHVAIGRIAIRIIAKISPMTIPNAEHSVVNIRKLRDYCLNPMYDEG